MTTTTTPSRRSVLFTITADRSLGFLEGHLRWLSSEYNVHVAVGKGPNGDTLSRTSSVHVHQLPFYRDLSLNHDFQALLSLTTIIRKIKPAAIISATPKASLITAIARLGSPRSRMIHEIYGFRHQGECGVKRNVIATFESFCAINARTVIAASESVREIVRNIPFTSGKNIDLLGSGSTDGVDVDKFSPENLPPNKLPDSFNPDLPTFGFVGRLHRDKGIDELMDAISHFNHQGTPIQFLLIGKGDGTEIPENIRNTRSVFAIGHVSEAAPWYRVMDSLVLPTYREGFPNVALEAQASGIPVITTTATGAVDSVRHGETGILIAPRDSAALIKAIEFYLSRPEVRRAHGRGGLEWVRSTFRREIVWDARRNIIRREISALRRYPKGRSTPKLKCDV